MSSLLSMSIFSALISVVTLHHVSAFSSSQNSQIRRNAFRSGPLHAEKKYPVVVVGNPSEALAASMALCTREVLNGLEKDDRPPVPPPQLVALLQQPHRHQIAMSEEMDSLLQNSLLFGQYQGTSPITVQNLIETINGVENFLSCIYDRSEDYGNPILHTATESRADKLSILANESIRNSISYFGLNLYSNLVQSGEGKFSLPKEEASDLGTRLQTFLDAGNMDSVAISMDLPSHLAMLQANRLPKSRGVLGSNDVFAIRDDIQEGRNVDNGSSMTIEYNYDYENPMGGSDPLLCPSYGNCVVAPNTINHPVVQFEANSAHAAAYTAMRGYGMNPISSLCVASSVKAIFKELGSFESAETGSPARFTPPPYNWDVIDRITEYCCQSRQNVIKEEGASRKKYREFGYK